MKFKTPTSIAVIGGTMSGKTHLVWRILHHGSVMFEKKPSKIVYCYLEDQPIVEKMEASLPNFFNLSWVTEQRRDQGTE